MRECPHCGCQGHGQTYAVTCSRCKKQKYPTLTEAPDPKTYVCVFCRAGGSEARQTAARRSARLRLVAS
jgi:hypothetical protein